MRVDWETVGRCVNRALHDLEPERSRRFDGLVNIGIDETSYKKGHKYITVIVNHDTNTVVWASEGHGKSALEKFYKQLTRKGKRVITKHWISYGNDSFYDGIWNQCIKPFLCKLVALIGHIRICRGCIQ